MSELRRNAAASCGGAFFAMINATLMQFPTVKKVVYEVEGNTNDFYEWVQVRESLHGKKHGGRSNFK